ncbi:2271_t:CDS:2 [Entrophospora sp. SA101]|nr:2271_t:CDS:2 [Entrophospora sp. SA101]CAJ0825786.1 7136_t:CDS:2 [Entrophospora sp. SA101]CAJ0846371.1 4329_t:CDS:2 [Entrophospora sp. SA101]CAJ0912922.1 17939_t:CDS:2 [Entrophospora sp. SA101]
MANLIWCGLNCRLIIVPFDTEVMDAYSYNWVILTAILVEEIDDAPDDAGVEDIDVNEKDVAFVAYEL